MGSWRGEQNMSGSDESNRGGKDNAGRDHEPKHAQDNEKAPQGSVGANRMSIGTQS